jgi:hypothetical protein
MRTINFRLTGTGDGVVCFHCAGGLHLWQHTDNVWEERAKWFPFCVYVRYVKGVEFDRECQKSEPDTTTHTNATGVRCTLM